MKLSKISNAIPSVRSPSCHDGSTLAAPDEASTSRNGSRGCLRKSRHCLYRRQGFADLTDAGTESRNVQLQQPCRSTRMILRAHDGTPTPLTESKHETRCCVGPTCVCLCSAKQYRNQYFHLVRFPGTLRPKP